MGSGVSYIFWCVSQISPGVLFEVQCSRKQEKCLAEKKTSKRGGSANCQREARVDYTKCINRFREAYLVIYLL